MDTEPTRDALLTAYDLGASSAGKTFDLPDGARGVLVPSGFRIDTVRREWPELERIKAAPTFHDIASFNGYVNSFKSSATVIFSEPGFIRGSGHTPIVQAVLDYHHSDTGHQVPDHCSHVASFIPRYSDQWGIWSKPRQFSQIEMAEFFEENARDIVEPTAAQMLDLVRTFKSNRKKSFNSLVYQQNGDVQLAYDDKAVDGSTVLPEALFVGIPVYFMGAAYKLKIFVRYKVGDGNVVFSLKPDRTDLTEADAFEDIRKAVKAATCIDAYLGKR